MDSVVSTDLQKKNTTRGGGEGLGSTENRPAAVPPNLTESLPKSSPIKESHGITEKIAENRSPFDRQQTPQIGIRKAKMSERPIPRECVLNFQKIPPPPPIEYKESSKISKNRLKPMPSS